MGAVWVALGTSSAAALAAGAFFALALDIAGARPRAWLSVRAAQVRLVAVPGGTALAATAAAAVVFDPADPIRLALVSGTLAVLVALATLLILLVEDGGAGFDGSEPEWWPSFEREFRSWEKTKTRV